MVCLLVAFIAQSKCKIMFQTKYKYKWIYFLAYVWKLRKAGLVLIYAQIITNIDNNTCTLESVTSMVGANSYFHLL